MANNLPKPTLTELRKWMVQTFASSDLKLLCADLGIDYENLAGEGKELKILELIGYFDRRGELDRLIQYCIDQRPGFPWAGGAAGSSTAVPSPISTTAPPLPPAEKTPSPTGEKVKILFLASDPSDAARLRLGQEYREIQEKLQLSKQRERFELVTRLSVRPADISQALLDEEPQVVHFSGHGTTRGELAFENALGESFPVPADALAALFEQFADLVQCVVLNACSSEIQAKALAQHIPNVIGMNQEVGDQAAIAFAVGFYQALGAGQAVEKAYKLGCVQIRLQGIPEQYTPVLIQKEKP